MSNDQCRGVAYNFAYFSFFFCKAIYSEIHLITFKLHHLCIYIFVCE